MPQIPDAVNGPISHLEECPGCSECDQLLEYYETCDECEQWGHKDAMNVVCGDDGSQSVLCYGCAEGQPPNESEAAT